MMNNLNLFKAFTYLKNKKNYRSLCAVALVGIAGCNNATTPDIKPATSNIEKRIYLKELTTGIKIQEIKGIKYKKVNTNIYVFDYAYYGGKRRVQAEVNEDGDIHTLKMSVNENFDSLKLNLEDKFTEDNNKKIAFLCSSEILNPNFLTTIKFRNCRISADSQVLRLEEIDIQRNQSGLPRIEVNLELEDEKLKKRYLQHMKDMNQKKEQELNGKKRGDI